MLSSVKVKTLKTYASVQVDSDKGSATTEKLYVVISKSTSHVVASVRTSNITVTEKI